MHRRIDGLAVEALPQPPDPGPAGGAVERNGERNDRAGLRRQGAGHGRPEVRDGAEARGGDGEPLPADQKDERPREPPLDGSLGGGPREAADGHLADPNT